ncbi:MAG: M20/M25/M40 family metallo-hydrolase [Armatimonadetes bacterium]|nr:M20/M25/M40 family metallo-hydrolase [Armatimonadota bacterium]MDE2207439.1 M20/M25/M40 family metallo-hydrolase [Armatimonadota bacterium]
MNTTIHQRPAELLQQLLRFNTTNPPGNEAACIGFIRDLLAEYGVPSQLIEKADGRPNLIARLTGSGSAPPLLLQGHVDVVPTAGQSWTHPPFAGELHDGMIWGRGAVDMKGGVAIMLAAFLRAKAENASLPGDVILCILCDEEAGGDNGARFLCEERRDLFAGVRFAIGEFGGFSLQVAGRTLYPIMVSEKQICWMRVRFRGPGGHASSPIHDTAMIRAARAIQALDEHPLPVHITPAACAMFSGFAEALPEPAAGHFRDLMVAEKADAALEHLEPFRKIIAPLIRNTACPTIIAGGSKVNVIPSEVVMEVDGRLLPGMTPVDMTRELGSLVGEHAEIEIVRHDRGTPAPDMALYPTLADILCREDPGAAATPLLLGGVTDARFFAQIGIQTYGFLPMKFPPDFDFWSTVHAADERVPAGAILFGANAVFQALQRFGAAS